MPVARVHAPQKGAKGHKRSRKFAQRVEKLRAQKGSKSVHLGRGRKKPSRRAQEEELEEQRAKQLTNKKKAKDHAQAERHEAQKREKRQQAMAEMSAEQFMDGGFERLLGELSSGDEDDFQQNEFDDDVGSDTEMATIDDDDVEDDDDDEDDEQDQRLSQKKKQKPKQSKSRTQSSADDDLEDEKDEEESDDEEDPEAEMGDEILSHRQQLEALKTKDPEFYEHLKKSAPMLLEFGDDELSSEGEEDDDDNQDESTVSADQDDEDGDAAAASTDGTIGDRIVLTEEMLDKWEKLATQENPSLKALKRLARAFESAVHVGDDDLALAAGSANGYRILQSDLYDRLMSFCLRELPECIRQYLRMPEPTATELSTLQQGIVESETPNDDEDGTGSSRSRLPHRCKKYPRVRGTVRLYLELVVEFLRQVSDEQMVCFVLRRADRLLVPFLASERRHAMSFLRVLTEVWSSDHENGRVLAFLAIRSLAVQVPYPFLQRVLRQSYLSYVRGATSANPAARSSQAFMRSCITELYGIDFAASYQHAFMYVRQLAIHFRNALAVRSQSGDGANSKNDKQTEDQHGKRKKKGPKGKPRDAEDPLAQLYSHQVLNSLRAWVQVLSAYPQQPLMSQLQYPVAQILLGIANTTPGERYLPARFHCLSMLVHLSSACHIHVPVAPFLLDALDKVLAHRGKFAAKQNKRTKDDHDMFAAHVIHVSRKEVGTLPFLDGAVTRALHLLLLHANTHAAAISFPEFIFPITLRLRQFAKECRRAPWTRQARLLIEQLEKHCDWMKLKRAHVPFSPCDVEKVDAFLQPEQPEDPVGPLGMYVKRFLAEYEKKQAALNEEWIPEAATEESGTSDALLPRETKSSKKSKKQKRQSLDDSADSKANKKSRRAPVKDSTEDDMVDEFVLSDSDSD